MLYSSLKSMPYKGTMIDSKVEYLGVLSSNLSLSLISMQLSSLFSTLYLFILTLLTLELPL